MQAQMVACILDNISLNVGLFVIPEFRNYKSRGRLLLLLSSLITELCKWDRVKEYSRDNSITPKTPIYPLKMLGEGTTYKRKNRNIDLGKSVKDDIFSCRPSSVGSFEDF